MDILMNTTNIILNNDNNYQLKINFDLVKSLSFDEKKELMSLLNTSYPFWGLDKIFENYPSYESLYIFRLRNSKGMLIGSRQILIVENIKHAPLWAQEIAKTLSIQYFAVSSRAIVHPDFRGQGIGTKLVQKLNQKTYSEHNVEVILGSSTSLSAIALYQHLGAKLWEGDINKINSIASKNNQPRTRMLTPVRYLYYKNNKNKTSDGYFKHYPLTSNSQASGKRL